MYGDWWNLLEHFPWAPRDAAVRTAESRLCSTAVCSPELPVHHSYLFTRATLTCFVLIIFLSFCRSDFSKTTESFLRALGKVLLILRDAYIIHCVYGLHG